jgi:hypothetical protein
MRRLPTASIALAILIPLLSATWAAGTSEALPLRNPQVAFNSAGLQAFLNEWPGGIQANLDQLDAQAISLVHVTRTFSVEYLQGSGIEFGVYDPTLGGSTARFPLFTAASARGSGAVCSLAGDSALVALEFDSLGVLVRNARISWSAHGNYGFYVEGPGGTWYSQDSRNAGDPHALTYAATGVYFGSIIECFEPGEFDADNPDSFTGLIVIIEPSDCPSPSVRAGRAFGTDCTPVVPSTWGDLKLRYR